MYGYTHCKCILHTCPIIHKMIRNLRCWVFCEYLKVVCKPYNWCMPFWRCFIRKNVWEELNSRRAGNANVLGLLVASQFKPLAKVEGHLMTSSEYYLAGKFFICCRSLWKEDDANMENIHTNQHGKNFWNSISFPTERSNQSSLKLDRVVGKLALTFPIWKSMNFKNITQQWYKSHTNQTLTPRGFLQIELEVQLSKCLIPCCSELKSW